jgi:hypothetical protein
MRRPPAEYLTYACFLGLRNPLDAMLSVHEEDLPAFHP